MSLATKAPRADPSNGVPFPQQQMEGLQSSSVNLIHSCTNLAQLGRLFRVRKHWNAFEREMFFQGYSRLLKPGRRSQNTAKYMVSRLLEMRANLPTAPEQCTAQDDLMAFEIRHPVGTMDGDMRRRFWRRTYELTIQETKLEAEDEEIRRILESNPLLDALLEGTKGAPQARRRRARRKEGPPPKRVMSGSGFEPTRIEPNCQVKG